MGKINKYEKFLEKDMNIRDDEYSYLNDRSDDKLDNDEMADMEHLIYLLRSMFKNNGIDVVVESKDLDISIYCTMNRREDLKDVLNVLSVVNKLKKDILPQYECEFDLWETKKGKPLLTFKFVYFGDEDYIPF